MIRIFTKIKSEIAFGIVVALVFVADKCEEFALRLGDRYACQCEHDA